MAIFIILSFVVFATVNIRLKHTGNLTDSDIKKLSVVNCISFIILIATTIWGALMFQSTITLIFIKVFLFILLFVCHIRYMTKLTQIRLEMKKMLWYITINAEWRCRAVRNSVPSAAVKFLKERKYELRLL